MREALTAADVATLNGDGNFRVDRGLYLAVRRNGAARSWLLRYRYRGKPRWMGLGPTRLVSLTEARRKAIAAQTLLYKGVDPLSEGRVVEKKADDTPTFKECALSYIKAHESGWSNPKHRWQWEANFDRYAYKVIGALRVNEVTTDHTVEILEPIWADKTETAKRLRGRIEKILDWAKSKGYRHGDNPAAWRGTLSHRLPAPRRVQRVVHHVAVSYAKAPALYSALAANENLSARLLRFIMMTASRYGEAAHATWAEFDLEEALWVVPADRMKMRKEHRVPLAGAVVEMLKALKPKKAKPTDHVFIVPGNAKPLSDTAVRVMLRRYAPKDADTHGLRSTFRDWVAEQTDYPGEVAEAALAHIVSSEVERAYKRTSFVDKRRAMMGDWAAFLIGSK